jgi:hypothetical protein
VRITACAQERRFSLYCALEQATYEVTLEFAHRGAAIEEARFVIDDDLAPNNHYHHRLMDYNNDPRTTYADVQRFFDFLQGRSEGRLGEQEEIVQLVAGKPAAVSQTDIENYKEGAGDFGLAGEVGQGRDPGLHAGCEDVWAILRIRGGFDRPKSHYDGPAIEDARQLISRTAPNASHYSARLVDYNDDPTVTFSDMQRLLETVEINLQRRMALQKK